MVFTCFTMSIIHINNSDCLRLQ